MSAVFPKGRRARDAETLGAIAYSLLRAVIFSAAFLAARLGAGPQAQLF